MLIIFAVAVALVIISGFLTNYLNIFITKCQDTKWNSRFYKYAIWFSTFSFLLGMIISVYNAVSYLFSWKETINYDFLGIPTIANVLSIIAYVWLLLIMATYWHNTNLKSDIKHIIQYKHELKRSSHINNKQIKTYRKQIKSCQYKLIKHDISLGLYMLVFIVIIFLIFWAGNSAIVHL